MLDAPLLSACKEAQAIGIPYDVHVTMRVYEQVVGLLVIDEGARIDWDGFQADRAARLSEMLKPLRDLLGEGRPQPAYDFEASDKEGNLLALRAQAARVEGTDNTFYLVGIPF